MEEKIYKLDVNGRAPRPRSKRMRETGGTVTAGGTVIVGAMDGLNGKLDKYIFDDMFEKVEISDGKFAIKAKYDFFSVSEVSAGGAGSGSGGTGSGIDEEQLWSILSNTGNEQIAKNHLTSALSGYATETWVTGKNYLTAITKSMVESVLTGNITTHTHSQYLTAHQAIYDLTIKAGSTTVVTFTPNAVAATLTLEAGSGISLTADETEKKITIANTYKYTLPTASASVLGGVKIGANITITNGVISTHAPYSHPSATANTIAAATGKVLSAITVNSLGHVTSVAAKTLAAGDIPTLSISKISGLQTALDSKLNASVFNDLFEKVTEDGQTFIKAKYNLFSVGEVAAGGAGTNSGSTGGIDEEQLWSILSNTGNEQIAKNHLTSALSGYATETWVTGKGYATQSWVTSKGYITSAALEGYATESWVTGKNYLTAITKAMVETVLTGNITTHTHSQYLTAHQAIYALTIKAGQTTAITFSPKTAAATLTLEAGSGISLTADATAKKITIANTYKYTLPTASASVLGGVKIGANITITNGVISTHAPYSHPSATANTIAAATGKVLSAITVNSLGHVTSVAAKTLAAGDIPTLSISKISGLQTTLDSKLNASVFNDLFEKVTEDGQTFIKAKYNFYSVGEVSAGGAGSGSGGTGSGIDEEQLWSILSNTGNEQIAKNHLTTALANYATQSWVTSQNYLKAVSLATISDLHASWDALLKVAPSAYITRWPSVSEVTSKQNLIIKLNSGTTEGTNMFTYNVTAAKTVNITPSAIGAAASSHNHSWANITSGKPTTLAGYGITDGVNAVSVTGSGNAVTSASVSGHTLTLTKGSTFLLSSQYTASDILTKLKTVDGSGSGLDADLLDGQHSSYYVINKASGNIDFNTLTRSGIYRLSYTTSGGATNGPSSCSWGQMLVLYGGGDTISQIAFDYMNEYIQVRSGNPSDVGGSGSWKSWRYLAFKDDNVASASKLTTTTAGSATRPVYFANGIPVAGTYTFGNASGNAAINNGTVCANLNADLLDGTHKTGLLTALSSSSTTNLSITVGGTTKSVADLYATTAEKLSTTSAGSATRPVYFANGIPVAGTYTFGNASGNAAINNGTVCTNLNADKLDGYDASSFESYKLVVIDASALNNNTWYPVTMSIGNSLQTRIRIEGNTSANASWNTRSDKMMALILDYTVNGSQWGWTTASRVVYQYMEGAGTSSCLGGLGQLTNSSTEYVFVRGGAKYNFYVSRFITPVLRTSTYTISSQSVSPTTTKPSSISINNALITSNVASATKLATARTLWGKSFDGTANISGALSYVTEINANAGAHMYIDSASGYNIGIRYNGSDSNGITITQTELRRLANAASYNLGSSTYRWANVYSVLGNFSGAVTMASTLAVSGNSTFTGKTTHNGGLASTTGSFSSTLSVSGATTLSSTLNVASTLTASNGIVTDYDGSTWISMATRSNLIRSATNNSASSAHALFRVKNNGGDAIVFGGLGTNCGFYGFTAEYISAGTNNYNWSTVWDVSTGKLTHNKAMAVSGAVTLSSTLSVASTSTFTGKTTHNGGITCSNGLTLNSGDFMLGSSSDQKIRKGAASATLWSQIHFIASKASNGGFSDILLNIQSSNTIQFQSGSSFIWFSNGNIAAQGELAAGASSDRRLKNILSTPDYKKRLLALGDVVDYEYNDIAFSRKVRTTEHRRYTGLIYQNVVNVLPQMAGKDNDGYGYLNYIHTDYINLIAGALQQTIRKQETIEQRVARLERENAELKQQLKRLAA